MDYNLDYFNYMTHRWNTLSFPFISAIIQKKMPRYTNGRILDLGCGSGIYYQQLKQKNNLVDGIDIADHSIELCKIRGYNLCLKADAIDLPFENNTYDFVFSTEVIEHIENFNKMLQEVHRILKPGGRMILTTTNYSTSLFVFFRRFKGRLTELIKETSCYLKGYYSIECRNQFVRNWCFEALGGHYHGFIRHKLIHDAQQIGLICINSGKFYVIPPIPFDTKRYLLKVFNKNIKWSILKRSKVFLITIFFLICNQFLRIMRLFTNNFYLVLIKK